MNIAPIVLFVYNRPQLTIETLAYLARNKFASESVLYIYADGPKENAHAEELDRIKEVREVIKSVSWAKELIVIEREKNLGLANSIIAGVTEVVKRHGTVIVLEDDLHTSSHFLEFMNTALEAYGNNHRMASIHGFVYPLSQELSTPFFLKGADCWGWATWESAWTLFEPDGRKLAHQLFSKNLVSSFDFDGEMDYSGMLLDQVLGVNNSWAIRWHASAFLSEKLTLYPNHALVHHVGTGEDATHSNSAEGLSQPFQEQTISLEKINPEESATGFKLFKEFFSKIKPKDNYKRPNFQLSQKQNIKKRVKKLVSLKPKDLYGWHGDYPTWKNAVEYSQGYNKKEILERTLKAALMVYEGKMPYERDGVVFERIEFDWPLSTALLTVLAENGNRLDLCDFGGAFGSSYFQNKIHFNSSANVKWCVVEQEEFVGKGRQFFENETALKFYYSIGEMEESGFIPQVLLLSSVLQYLEEPYKWMKYFIALQYPYIILDRTSFITGPYERITVQTVPPEIYSASYPCHFFKEEKLLDMVCKYYDLIADFPSFCDSPSKSEDGNKLYWKGFLLKRKQKKAW
jgi:putative methyltransferase (TIGR04325 family)